MIVDPKPLNNKITRKAEHDPNDEDYAKLYTGELNFVERIYDHEIIVNKQNPKDIIVKYLVKICINDSNIK